MENIAFGRPYLDEVLVNITPAPVLSRFQRLDNGMLCGVKVLGRVLVLGLVTTADMPTDEAHSQMDPAVARFQTFFTTFGIWFDGLNLVKVRTLRHAIPPK